MEKLCKTCSRKRDVKFFSKRTYSSGTVGYQPKCKDCERSKRSQYYKPHEKIRQQLKISEQYYNTLMENVNCQICGVEMEKKCIDHCHETKKIRGVLCNNCNTALGLFKDNQKVMKNAIQYLEQSTQLQSH